MKPFLLAALLLTHGRNTPAQMIHPNPRYLFASHLQEATLEKRIILKRPDGNLKIEAGGIDGRVLTILDDSESAKEFFDATASDRATREGLLNLGFRVLILINQKHGVFVFDLVNGNGPEDGGRTA